MSVKQEDNIEYPARYWHKFNDELAQCDLCPHECKLQEGQSGLCRARKISGGKLVSLVYGRSSGFCIDPVEKKPLNHFFPGTDILSYGTIGCNLSCKFCQNWHISASGETRNLTERASAKSIAQVAKSQNCKSVAFTYNEPIISCEYTLDTADACKTLGIKTVAVTAGYINPVPRKDFFERMDAVNIDLKSFSEDFYHKFCGAGLKPVLDTLSFVRHKTACWLEITNLLIPGLNDTDSGIKKLCEWIFKELGPEVPAHFSAFHPNWKMTEAKPTPASTLERARHIAMDTGLLFVYTGNAQTPDGETTFCPSCGKPVINRDGYKIISKNINPEGKCLNCHSPIPGRF